MRSSFWTWALIALVAATAPAPARGQAGAFNVDSVRGPTKALDFTTTEGTWMGVDVSPDGQRIVFDLLGHLYEMPFAGGEATPLTRGRSFNHLPRYSPDGTRILFTSDRSGKEEIWILHRGTDSLEKVSAMPFRAFAATWSRDGRSIYLAAMDLGARYTGHRADLYGSRTELATGGVFGSPTHWTEHPTNGKVYFSVPGGSPIYQGGFRIMAYDLRTGETAPYIERPGGAADPVLSPDGKTLVYIHRDDKRTVLVLHDLATQSERVLGIRLDRDRMESGAGVTFGTYPNYAWTPDSREIVISYGGTIHAVDVATSRERPIPFRAAVHRDLAATIRFPIQLPASGTTKTRSHRWGQRTDRGVLYEALGDIYFKSGAQATNLTNSPSLESSPVYDRSTNTVYYASWRDDSLGSVWAQSLAQPRPPAVRLSSQSTQYGSLSLSQDGRTLAFLRGSGTLNRGASLEEQNEFDLVTIGPDRAERFVTKVSWKATNPMASRRPPAISFSPDGGTIYFDETVRDTLYLTSVRSDGMDRRTLYAFPHGQRALLSPDGQWIAYREYLRSYLTPASFAGKVVTVSGYDKQGTSYRVHTEDGEYLEWSPDGKGLTWTRGGDFYEKSVAEVLANKPAVQKTDLTIDYEVAVPSSTIALTNARVITVDGRRRVLENATILIRRNQIEAVGKGVGVPAGARVFNLQGKTVMPGMIDAHGHYNPDGSTLNVVEQSHVGLVANLAYGTTTVYEVYGNHVKDFAVSDLQRSGKIVGSRLLSVGPPIYGLRQYRTKLFRPIESQADADEVVSFNKAYGATALKDYVQFNRSARMQMYDAARRMGVNVVAETAVDFQMDWTMLMDGVSGLEHTVGLTPLYNDVIRLWSATQAGNTPTLIVVYNGPQGETAFHQEERLWEDPKLLQFFPKDELMPFRRPTRFFPDDIYATEMASQIRKLAQAGVSVQVSGHGQMHGLDKHWEMELMSRGGFTNAEIMAIATINSAKYLGLDAQLGSIEPGKLADLVILDANPLVDIRNTRKIDMVMLNGVLYRGTDTGRVFPIPEPALRRYWFRGSSRAAAEIDRP
jgi:imidazolonepropionase-like amidohydrolase/Tol biopolymer transport system component